MSQAPEHSDGVDELVRSSVKTTLMAAAAAAEVLARGWREQKASAAHASAQAAEAHRRQLEAQRTLARVELGAADGQWFAGATPEQVSRVWETASTWAELEPSEFASHRETLRARIEERFAIDMDQLTTDASAVLGDAQRAPRPSVGQAGVAEAGIESAAAVVVAAGAGTDRDTDEAERTAGRVEYDSDERRSQLFDRATSAGVDNETATARVRASEAFAEPSAKATRSPRRRGRSAAAAAQTNPTMHLER